MSRGKKIKLRTAGDVISRLRWSQEGEDCGLILIGYEDRIKGPMEKSIADFKSMDEGGDIPQHRIHYFRRMAPQETLVSASDMNQLILWDREARIDRIFGSGMGREAPASEDTIRLCFAAISNMQRIAEEKEIRRQERAKQRERRQLRAGKTLMVVGTGRAQNESAGSSSGRHQWSNGDWFVFSSKDLSWNKGVSNPRPTKSSRTRLPRLLRCVTWNVLFDEHGPETPLFDGDNPRGRWGQAIKMLAAAEADLIALQEVTPGFVELLCESLWVQERYALSASPGDCSSVAPFGNLLLWKWEALEVVSPSLAVLSDGKRKRSVIACLRSATDPETAFMCANVHLPCDATGDGAERQSRATARRRELNSITAKLQFMEQQLHGASAKSIVPIVMGDFNTDSKDRELENLLGGVFVDVWSLVSNGREGFTYDPEQNKRASRSLRGRRRIDRVFVGRGAGEYSFPLTSTDGGLIGVSSNVEGDPPSDHYGLSISFAWEMNSPFKGANRRLASHNAWAGTAIPTTDTLLALTLGESSEVQAKLFDPNSSLPVPHITLLNGFAEMLSLESCELASKTVDEAVASILDAVPNCEIPFSPDSLTVFEHPQSASLVCKPDTDCHWLRALYNTLRAAFRFCDEQERRFETGWSPHVTLGKFGSENDARKQANDLIRNGLWFRERCSVPAQSVVIYQRDPSDRKFYPVATFPLERKPRNLESCSPGDFIRDAGASLASYYLKASAPFFSTIEHVCQECIVSLSDGQLEARLQRYGSCNFHASLPSVSDIDAVVDVFPLQSTAIGKSMSLSVNAYWRLVASRLQSIYNGAKVRMRIAGGANGLATQFLTVRLSPVAPTVDLLLNLRDVTGSPLLGSAIVEILDDGRAVRNAILEHANSDTDMKVFEGALRLCKLWAYRRRIYGASLGFLGGGGWALLLARAMSKGMANGDLQLGCTQEEGDMEKALLKVLSYFFRETLISWDQTVFNLREGAAVCESIKEQTVARGTIAVLAPCSGENFARNVTKSTVSALFQELQRANSILKSGSLGGIFVSMNREELLAERASVMLLELAVGKLATQGLCIPEVKAWAACQMLQTLVALENALGEGVRIRPLSRPLRIRGKLLYIVTVEQDVKDLDVILRKRQEYLRLNAESAFRSFHSSSEDMETPMVVLCKCLSAELFRNAYTTYN